MAAKDKTPKTKRRRRVSGYIDIDHISDPPGDDYVNWRQITQRKLKERETKLMAVRIASLQTILAEQCKAFEAINSSQHKVTVPGSNELIGKEVVSDCLEKLYLSLQLWNGVNLAKTKKALNSFRDYFMIGKSWFDSKKKKIIGPDFWIRVFRTLERFVVTAASVYFNERFPDLQAKYSKALLLHLFCNIFGGHLHFAETKPQPMIPCGILKDCDPMKQYLVQLHSDIDIKALIQERKAANKGINAMEILDFVNRELLAMSTRAHREFQRHFQALWNDVNLLPLNQQGTNKINGIDSINTVSVNQYHSNGQSMNTMNTMNTMNGMNSTNINPNGYGNGDGVHRNHHGQSQPMMHYEAPPQFNAFGGSETTDIMQSQPNPMGRSMEESTTSTANSVQEPIPSSSHNVHPHHPPPPPEVPLSFASEFGVQQNQLQLQHHEPHREHSHVQNPWPSVPPLPTESRQSTFTPFLAPNSVRNPLLSSFPRSEDVHSLSNYGPIHHGPSTDRHSRYSPLNRYDGDHHVNSIGTQSVMSSPHHSHHPVPGRHGNVQRELDRFNVFHDDHHQLPPSTSTVSNNQFTPNVHINGNQIGPGFPSHSQTTSRSVPLHMNPYPDCNVHLPVSSAHHSHHETMSMSSTEKCPCCCCRGCCTLCTAPHAH